MEQIHLVQKYTFEVEFGKEDQAYQLQTRLASFIKEKIVSLTEEIFNEYSIDLSVGINKVVIDLGNINLDNYEQEIYVALKKQLSAKLNLLLTGNGISTP